MNDVVRIYLISCVRQVKTIKFRQIFWFFFNFGSVRQFLVPRHLNIYIQSSLYKERAKVGLTLLEYSFILVKESAVLCRFHKTRAQQCSAGFDPERFSYNADRPWLPCLPTQTSHLCAHACLKLYQCHRVRRSYSHNICLYGTRSPEIFCNRISARRKS